jgi:hypothetical protein
MRFVLTILAILPFAMWIVSELYNRRGLRIVAVCMWTCVLGFIIYEEFGIIQRVQWHNHITINEIEKQLQNKNIQHVLKAIEYYHNVYNETHSSGKALQALNNHLKCSCSSSVLPPEKPDSNPQNEEK